MFTSLLAIIFLRRFENKARSHVPGFVFVPLKLPAIARRLQHADPE